MKASISCRIIAAAGMSLAALGAPHAAPSCNTRSGQVANQPGLPPILTPSEIIALPVQTAPEISAQERALKTVPLRLETDIDSLITFEGPYTTGVPVLGLRLENYPNFDQKAHCNRIAAALIKPRIEQISPGRYKASYDNGRFSIEFGQGTQLAAWKADLDPEGRLIWIFPAVFGKHRKTDTPGILTRWELTESYDKAFRLEPKNSHKRRWVAEAYLHLALRTYRQRELGEKFPVHHVSRDDVWQRLEEKSNIDCKHRPEEFLCLLSALIEKNEADHGDGKRFSNDVFRAGDALLVNSGISTGIRQLDFASKNEQASALAPKLIPSLFAKDQRGYGWRRPIRLWEVKWLNAWYADAGMSANQRLSEREAQWMLLESHVEYLQSAGKTLQLVRASYPAWSATAQVFVALVRADLENVSGYGLHLPKGAANHCAVLSDRNLDDSNRSNHGVAANHPGRVRNARDLVLERFPGAELEKCAAT